MAWESRGNNDYYYRKTREGKRVKSEYVGKGELAGLLSRLDQIDRAQKEIEAEKTANERRKVEQIDDNLDIIEANAQLLVDTFLISRGFYKTKSREWRYRK